MRFDLDPYVGALPVRFGMPRADVRRVLGPDLPKTKTMRLSPFLRDTFLKRGAHVFYRDPDVCEAVELFTPAVPNFQNQLLLGRPLSEVARWLRGLDPSTIMDPTGLNSPLFGIGCYVPNAVEDPDAAVEGVIAFERGYYERYGVA